LLLAKGDKLHTLRSAAGGVEAWRRARGPTSGGPSNVFDIPVTLIVT
jgi:hypothetical protein